MTFRPWLAALAGAAVAGGPLTALPRGRSAFEAIHQTR